MQVQEVISMLRWVSETDPRVQFNDSAVEMWLYALRTIEPAVAKQAILEHYKQNEGIAASPAAISKRAGYIRTAREAGQRAITHQPAPPRHPMSWRSRNPAEWDRLFEAGRREGNAERARATAAREGREDREAA